MPSIFLKINFEKIFFKKKAPLPSLKTHFLENKFNFLEMTPIMIGSACEELYLLLIHLVFLAILGVAHSDFITEDLPHISVVGSAEQMFEMTALGRVDLAIDTSINGLAYLKKSPLKNIKLCGVVKTHKLYVYLNEKSKALAKPLSSRIRQLIKFGELNQWIKEEEKKLLEN